MQWRFRQVSCRTYPSRSHADPNSTFTQTIFGLNFSGVEDADKFANMLTQLAAKVAATQPASEGASIDPPAVTQRAPAGA